MEQETDRLIGAVSTVLALYQTAVMKNALNLPVNLLPTPTYDYEPCIRGIPGTAIGR